MSSAPESDLPETLKRDLLSILGLEQLPPPRTRENPRSEPRHVRFRAHTRRGGAAIHSMIPRLATSRMASTLLGVVLLLALAGGAVALLERAPNGPSGDPSSGEPYRTMARPPRSDPPLAPSPFDTEFQDSGAFRGSPPAATAPEGRFVTRSPDERRQDRGERGRGDAKAPPAAQGDFGTIAAAATQPLPAVSPRQPPSSPDPGTAIASAPENPGAAGDPPFLSSIRNEDPQRAESEIRRRSRIDGIDALRALRR